LCKLKSYDKEKNHTENESANRQSAKRQKERGAKKKSFRTQTKARQRAKRSIRLVYNYYLNKIK
tara:strand:- start:288 stop:479 length:192 start_codon:yes stop_codon:yes gene_type:complete